MMIQSLQDAMNSNGPLTADSPKLKSAAHEFEASLLQELLKPLEKDPLFEPDNSEAAGGASDHGDDQGSSQSIMSFGSEAMAKAISERGGFGIATKILDHFRTVEKGASAAKASKS